MNDSQLIEKLGGPAKLARALGYCGKFGTQRVTNWKTRGIPARVMLNHRDLFASAREELSQNVDSEEPRAPPFDGCQEVA